jgi:hypothetical protein
MKTADFQIPNRGHENYGSRIIPPALALNIVRPIMLGISSNFSCMLHSILFMALQPFVRPLALFQFLNPIHSR